MTSLKINCIIACLWLRIGQITAILPIVTTSNGPILGAVEVNYFGEPYYSYKGIPYAQPPVGPLRFRSPVPNAPWNGVLSGLLYGPRCAQLLAGVATGSEDCLTINVFTKSAPNQVSSLRPVMVFMHGGGLKTGGAPDYGPGFFMMKDMVLVVPQYRLNAMGFLSMSDRRVRVPGNAGFRDQVLALRWVQKHIAAFGGDPNCVTIFGESAGGVSVDLLCFSPLARGLFHRAICQSGVARKPLGFNIRQAESLALGLGCYYTDQQEMFDCMQQQPMAEVLRIQSTLAPNLQNPLVSVFSAIVEAPSDEPAFLDESIETMIANKDFSQVPKMFGYNTDEGYLILQSQPVPNPIIPQSLLPFGTRAKLNSAKSLRLAKLIYDFYFGNSSSSDLVKNYINYNTDCLYLDRIYDSALIQEPQSTASIFFYEFNYKTRMNSHLGDMTPPPVSHGDELKYLFVNLLTPPILDRNSTEFIAVDRMLEMWVNFAKTGRPIPTPKPPVLANVTWNPVAPGMFNYLVINPSMTSKVNPEPARMQLWQQFHYLEDTLFD